MGRPIRQVDAQLAGQAGQPLRILAETFALSQAELDLIQTCLAQQHDQPWDACCLPARPKPDRVRQRPPSEAALWARIEQFLASHEQRGRGN